MESPLARIFFELIKTHHNNFRVFCLCRQPLNSEGFREIRNLLGSCFRRVPSPPDFEHWPSPSSHEWLSGQLERLRGHYRQLIRGLEADLSAHGPSTWIPYWEVALEWVRWDSPGELDPTMVGGIYREVTVRLGESLPPRSERREPLVECPSGHGDGAQLANPQGAESHPISSPPRTFPLEKHLNIIAHVSRVPLLAEQTPRVPGLDPGQTQPDSLSHFKHTQKSKHSMAPEADLWPPGQDLGWELSAPLTPSLDQTEHFSPTLASRPLPTRDGLAHSSNDTPMFTSHRHYGMKFYYWSLTPARPILILGCSNLARLPTLYDRRIQISSYPGAKLVHAIHILHNKTLVSPDVRHVILSFGLNDRGGRPWGIQLKLDNILRQARVVFPNAHIWPVSINYSGVLKDQEKQTLDLLNSHIESQIFHIPKISQTDFVVGRDGIHWTNETGSLIWQHWATHLNLQTLPPPRPPHRPLNQL